LALALRAVDIVVLPEGPRFDEVLETCARAAAMAALFYLFRAGYRRWRGREGLGLGDVKLAAVAGAWVDWRLLPYVVEAAAVFGLGLALYRARTSGVAAGRNMKLPFGAGFAPAIWLGWSLGLIGL
jgi:leader peptidase (prepilin peptidase)/N-methyltransferase